MVMLQLAYASRRRHRPTERGRARSARAWDSPCRRVRLGRTWGERPDSDIDILVEFEPGAEGSIYDYMNLKEYVASLFDGPVDVIDRGALKRHLRGPSARDAVYAF